MRIRVLSAFALALTCSLTGLAAGLRVGVARVDITPEWPVSLEGYSNLEERVSEGVHDRLYARVYVFQESSNRLVLISCDVSGFVLNTFPFFQTAVLERHNLKPEQLFLVGIHTHSGPLISLNRSWPNSDQYRYAEQLRGKVLAAVAEASSALEPAVISVGSGYSAVSVSRREPGPDGRVSLGRNPNAPVDRQVIVVRLTTPSGKDIGSLFNYACHSRSLSKESRWISGDLLGIAEQYAEARLHHTVAAFPGASADIDPWTTGVDFPLEPGRTSETETLAARLADEIVVAATAARGLEAPFFIRSSFTRLPVAGRWGKPKRIALTVAAIGELALVGIDCEMFNEIGSSIKAKSPFRHTLVLTLCNGGSGYLVPAHRYSEGGYEVGITPFAPQTAELVEAKALTILEELIDAVKCPLPRSAATGAAGVPEE